MLLVKQEKGSVTSPEDSHLFIDLLVQMMQVVYITAFFETRPVFGIEIRRM